MNEHSTESVLSALLRANSPSGSTQGLVDAMLTIQTQLSVIQENQRKIMKTLREIKIEQRTRMSDLKRSTQVLLKDTPRHFKPTRRTTRLRRRTTHRKRNARRVRYRLVQIIPDIIAIIDKVPHLLSVSMENGRHEQSSRKS